MVISTKRSLTTAELITYRRNRVLDARAYTELLFRVVLFAAAAWVLFTQVFLITQITGNEMFPAVKDGDLVFAYRLQDVYAKDDVVLFHLDGKLRIGRVAARETDVVSIDEEGTLRVNGTVQTGEIVYPTYPREGVEYPYAVPDGHVFILADYRTQATDSRDYGSVPLDNVQGKVITILRRRGL